MPAEECPQLLSIVTLFYHSFRGIVWDQEPLH